MTCKQRQIITRRMAGLTIEQAFQLALQHHQAGRLVDAEALYRQIVAAAPGHSEAWHHLGLLAHQTGRSDDAIEWIQNAIAQNSEVPLYYSNLGEICRLGGKVDQAIGILREAILRHPNSF